MSARTIAIGDIHGCATALRTLLEMLEVTGEDTVVVLGDIVDRGPDTKNVIEQLLELKSVCRKLVYIRGNHEEMMLDALEDGPLTSLWMMHGGLDVLSSYDVKTVTELPKDHMDFIKSSIDYWERETEIFVHASLQYDVPLAEQSRQFLRWERYKGNEPPYSPDRLVVVGHTVMPHGMPKNHAGWVAIDTGVYNDQPLTALDLSSDTFYQADERGNQFPTFPFNREVGENP